MFVAWSAMRSRCRTAENSDRPGFDMIRRPLHDADQLLDDRRIESVDFVIEADDLPGQPGIEMDKRIQAVADHDRGHVGHALQFLGIGTFGGTASTTARSAMSSARSAIRSRSVLIIRTAAMRRRSIATG